MMNSKHEKVKNNPTISVNSTEGWEDMYEFSVECQYVAMLQVQLVANKTKYSEKEYKDKYKRTEKLLKKLGFYKQFEI
jgi:hypothetical protein